MSGGTRKRRRARLHRACAHTLGEHGPALVDLSVVSMNFGAVCSYIILIGGLVYSMLVEWSAASAEPGSVDVIISWWQSSYFVTPVMVLFFVLPPCLVRHFSNLRCTQDDSPVRATLSYILRSININWLMTRVWLQESYARLCGCSSITQYLSQKEARAMVIAHHANYSKDTLVRVAPPPPTICTLFSFWLM